MTTFLELCVSASAGTMQSLLKKTALLGFVPCAETTLIFTVCPRRNLTTLLGSCVIFALLDVLSSVPAFRPSRTQWAVSLAEDAAVTHQKHSKALHS